MDHQRRRRPAQSDRQREHGFKHAEHTAQHLVRGDPLQQRHPGDVHEYVPHTHHDQHRECESRVREHGNQCDRKAPRDQPAREIEGLATAAHQRCGHHTARQPSHTDGGIQQTDA